MGLQEEWFGAYADGVAGILRAVCDGFHAETVNILATHVFVDGSRLAAVDGSERLLHIGQAYGVTGASLPAAPQYIALGHIHEPQEVLAAPVPTAHSGPRLQLHFGARGQQKVARILDAGPGRPARGQGTPARRETRARSRWPPPPWQGSAALSPPESELDRGAERNAADQNV